MTSRLTSAALLACAVMAARAEAAPLTEVWPTRVQPRADGRMTYVYSLTALKKGAEHAALVEAGEDPEATAEFLASLPSEVRVLASLRNATYQLDAADALVPGPLSESFVEAAAVAAKAGGSEGRAAHDVLPSADALLWKGQRALDGMVAGIQLAVEEGKWGLPHSGAAFWDVLLVEAERRTRQGTEDQRAGARLLAARLGAARCARGKALPKTVAGNVELRAAIDEERRDGAPDVLPILPSEVDGWTPALECLAERERRLGRPLPLSRIGVIAALQLLAILESDAKLRATWEGLTALRDALAGAERTDELARFRQLLGETRASRALEDPAAFIAKLAEAGLSLDGRLKGPAIFTASRTPVQRFVSQLEGAERLHALEEAAVAATDGRLALEPEGDAPPEVWRSAALAPLLNPRLPGAPDALSTSADYRSRLLHAFHALQGAPIDLQSLPEGEGESTPVRGSELKLVLRVPPTLDIEPVPEAYARLSRAFSRMQAILRGSKKGSAVYGLSPGGKRRGQTAGVEAARLQALYRGLSKLALSAVGVRPEKERDEIAVDAARNWLKGWRRDPDLREDARWVLPRSGGARDEPHVGGAFGVGLRRVGVTFESLPKLDLEASGTNPRSFELDATATQRYVAPVLVTRSVRGEAAPPRAKFQQLADRAGGEVRKIEAALSR